MSHIVIVGAGPAGASLAYLLVTRGVEVTLLERRRNFEREFRGEVLMPSGIEALEQMGLAALLQEIPSRAQTAFDLYVNGRSLLKQELGEDSFRGRRPLAISQPALLEAVVELAAKSPLFHFQRGASVKELLSQTGRVTGVRIRSEEGEQVIESDLVIGADGRHSAVRRQAGLGAQENSPPMDIVWCKLPLPDNWNGVHAFVGRGHLLVAYHSGDGLLQVGWVILKGTFGEFRDKGITDWVETMAHHVSPDLAQHLRTHKEATEKPFLLECIADCVEHWSVPGALVIGDAAHTMSPVAGQGVNIALRDAIVTANHLVPIMATDTPAQEAVDDALRAIEAERMREVAPIQAMQAQPPKIVLSRAWWGEPVRWLAGKVLTNESMRQRIITRGAAFPYGVTEVQLKV